MSNENIELFNDLQEAALKNAEKKQLQLDNNYEFDLLSMYFREDYYVKGIRIVQPTINDILKIGEQKFYSGISPFLSNSTSIRVMLWDSGIDWCKTKDIEVFNFLNILSKNQEAYKFMFPDYRIENMQLVCKVNSNKEKYLCLYDKKKDFLLEESDYNQIAEYIRTLFDIHPKIEKTKGKTTKQWMIDEDRMNIAQSIGRNNSSTLLPLVSACINHPGFKYKTQELKDVGIYEFMDSVKRLQVYESTKALLLGSYIPFNDFSKISSEKYNFMREIK